MTRCPSCGAHRAEEDDYCPVCGETLTDVQFSEATAKAWYERSGALFLLVLLFWPAALYGLYQRGEWSRPENQVFLIGCFLMAFVWLAMA
jgi:hypothetical protein